MLRCVVVVVIVAAVVVEFRARDVPVRAVTTANARLGLFQGARGMNAAARAAALLSYLRRARTDCGNPTMCEARLLLSVVGSDHKIIPPQKENKITHVQSWWVTRST